MSHTLKPWAHQVNPGDGLNVSNHFVVKCSSSSLDGRWVADCGGGGLRKDSSEYLERAANARLIAAAPELLEACELTEFYARHPTDVTEVEYNDFLAHIRTLGWDGTSILDFLSGLRRKAIAKARGEDPA